MLCYASLLSHLLVTPWTVAHQAPLSMEILQARILEWVAMPSPRGCSQPKDRTQASHIAGEFFTWILVNFNYIFTGTHCDVLSTPYLLKLFVSWVCPWSSLCLHNSFPLSLNLLCYSCLLIFRIFEALIFRSLLILERLLLAGWPVHRDGKQLPWESVFHRQTNQCTAHSQATPLSSSQTSDHYFTVLNISWGFPGGLVVKNLPVMWETQVCSIGQEDLWRRERLGMR